jgi:hypothetical protein
MRAITTENLHIFHALACYHAALCLSIYGLLSKSVAKIPTGATSAEGEIIFLDQNETTALRRWITSGIGSPVISNIVAEHHVSTHADGPLYLGSTSEVTSAVIGIVQHKFRELSEAKLLLVENICRLMRSIGKINLAELLGLAGTRE